jgi:hypothetical protein
MVLSYPVGRSLPRRPNKTPENYAAEEHKEHMDSHRPGGAASAKV